MTGLGAIDWDETYGGFQHKLGYCKCGEKVLATSDELEEIVSEFSYLKTRRKMFRGLAILFLRKLV